MAQKSAAVLLLSRVCNQPNLSVKNLEPDPNEHPITLHSLHVAVSEHEQYWALPKIATKKYGIIFQTIGLWVPHFQTIYSIFGMVTYPPCAGPDWDVLQRASKLHRLPLRTVLAPWVFGLSEHFWVETMGFSHRYWVVLQIPPEIPGCGGRWWLVLGFFGIHAWFVPKLTGWQYQGKSLQTRFVRDTLWLWLT